MQEQVLEKLIETNNGILQVCEASKLGISAPTVYKFAKTHGLKRLSKGVYGDPNGWNDEMWLASIRWPRAVFSHHSALYIHALTDREPAALTVTVPSGYNASTLRASGARAFYIKPELLEMGKTVVTTPDGHNAPCYDLERTMCDIIRSRAAFDPQCFHSALQSYARRGDKQLGLLSSYADRLGVQGTVTHYLEVLL